MNQGAMIMGKTCNYSRMTRDNRHGLSVNDAK